MLKFRSTVASALSSTPGTCMIVAMLLVEAASQDYWQFWLLAVLLAASQPAACILGIEKSFNYLAIWGFTPRIMGTCLIGFGSLLYVLTAIQPAQAIFFATAETWFASKFGAIPGFSTTLTLAVNLLRALFVVFIICWTVRSSL